MVCTDMIDFSLLCKQVIVDLQTSLFSAINIVRGVNFVVPEDKKDLTIKLPAGLCLLIGWSENETGAVVERLARIVVFGSEGDKVHQHEFSFEHQIGKGATSKVQFGELEFTSSGVTRFQIEIKSNGDWQAVGENTLEFKILKG